MHFFILVIIVASITSCFTTNDNQNTIEQAVIACDGWLDKNHLLWRSNPDEIYGGKTGQQLKDQYYQLLKTYNEETKNYLWPTHLNLSWSQECVINMVKHCTVNDLQTFINQSPTNPLTLTSPCSESIPLLSAYEGM